MVADVDEEGFQEVRGKPRKAGQDSIVHVPIDVLTLNGFEILSLQGEEPTTTQEITSVSLVSNSVLEQNNHVLGTILHPSNV